MKRSYSIFFISLILCLCVINFTHAYAKNYSTFDSILSHFDSFFDIEAYTSEKINIIVANSELNNELIEINNNTSINNNITQDEIELMAKLVAAESIGEPYTGKVAVASVVLNRVSNPKFPNTIENVIFQKNAFSCVKNNTLNSYPNEECYKAVHEAINGSDPTNKALFFYNPKIATCNWMKHTNKVNKLTIGHHTFFKTE